MNFTLKIIRLGIIKAFILNRTDDNSVLKLVYFKVKTVLF